MITRQEKEKICEKLIDKEERIFFSQILDKINRFEKSNQIMVTSFLDIYQVEFLIPILNQHDIAYQIYAPNVYCEKKVIFFVPSDTATIDYDKYLCCIQISNQRYHPLKHRDYMGSIYHLGIKREMIGDIILEKEEAAYAFFIKSVSEYVMQNLVKVANQEVSLSLLPLDSEKVKSLRISYQSICVNIASFRVDCILSSVYNKSRTITKEKIEKSQVFVNAKLVVSPNKLLKEGDIVSCKGMGKFRIGNLVKKTKNGNLVVEIEKYS